MTENGVESGHRFHTGGSRRGRYHVDPTSDLVLWQSAWNAFASSTTIFVRGRQRTARVDVMVGALLCGPVDPGCLAGVIFFNNVGYSDVRARHDWRCHHTCLHGQDGSRFLQHPNAGWHRAGCREETGRLLSAMSPAIALRPTSRKRAQLWLCAGRRAWEELFFLVHDHQQQLMLS